jgi:hypothetical protein
MNIDRFKNTLKNSVQNRSNTYGVLFVALLFWASLVLVPPTRVFAVQATGFLGYFLLLYLLIFRTETWKTLHSLPQSTKWFLSILSISSIVFFGWYISQFQFLPIWDQLNYWSQTLSFNKSLITSVHQTFYNLVQSINFSDYNQLLCWLFSLPVALFPEWKATFFAEYLLVLLPGALLFSTFICTKIKEIMHNSNAIKLIPVAFVVVLSSAIYTRPMLLGYLDCIPAIIFLCVIIAVFDESFIDAKVGSFFIGVAVTLTFMLRRWFLFGCVGLAAGVAFYWIVRLVANHETRVGFKKFLINVSLIFVGAVLPMVFFPEFIKRTFLGNQSTAYKSWTFIPSFGGKVIDLFHGFGYIWLVASILVFLILAFRHLHSRTKEFLEIVYIETAFLISSVIGIALFWRVQDLGPQHWYILYFFVSGTVMLTLVSFVSIQKGAWKTISTGTLCALAVISLVQGLSLFPPTASRIIEKTLGIYEMQSIPTQTDLNEKYRLVAFLKQRVKKDESVYFAAASSTLNSTLPYASCLPECNGDPFPVQSADVDSRDGFNTAFFTASYVVTSIPVSYHMDPKNEQVVTNLSEMVQQSDSYIGSHYRKISKFNLSDGVSALVYQRTSDFSIDDVKQLRDNFQKIYPESPELFADRFNAYIESLKNRV